MVTIVVPVYNAEKTINRTLESIFAQTYKDIELILIDDESKDRSGEICEQFKREHSDKRIKVIHQSNKGDSGARNTGLRYASGEFIFFVDSDDLIESDACEILVKEQQLYNADIVYGGMKICDNDKVTTSADKARYYENVAQLVNDFPELYLKFTLHHASGTLYRTDKARIGFREGMNLGEDLEFNIRYLTNASGIRISNQSIYNYVKNNPGSLTLKYKSNRVEMIREVYHTAIKGTSQWFGEQYDHKAENTLLIADLVRAVQMMARAENITKKQAKYNIERIETDAEFRKAAENMYCPKLVYKAVRGVYRMHALRFVYDFYHMM